MVHLNRLSHRCFQLKKPWPMETNTEGRSTVVRVPDTTVSSSAVQCEKAMREAGRRAADRLLILESQLAPLSDSKAREWRALKPFLQWKGFQVWRGLDAETTVPDFLREQGMTVRELRDRLGTARGQEWVLLAGLILREANPEDALDLLRLGEIRGRWEELQKHVGQRSQFWEWLFGWRGIPEGRIVSRVASNGLLSEFWVAQGLKRRAANVLAYAVRAYSWPEIEHLTKRELLGFRDMGKLSAAEILALVERKKQAESF